MLLAHPFKWTSIVLGTLFCEDWAYQCHEKGRSHVSFFSCTIFVLALEWIPLMPCKGHHSPTWQLNNRRSPLPPSSWSGAAHRQPVADNRDRKLELKSDLYSQGPGVKFTGIIARCNFPAPFSTKCSLRAKHLVNYKEVPEQNCLQIKIMENQKPNAHNNSNFFFSF